jgi:hypothetical protein
MGEPEEVVAELTRRYGDVATRIGLPRPDGVDPTTWHRLAEACARATRWRASGMTTRPATDIQTWHARSSRRLSVIFAAAVVVSVIHYADNYLNYSDFRASDSLPRPSAGLVGASWFVFTAVGLLGYLRFRRAPDNLALGLLAFYSGSGLVGSGHYAAAAATSMPPLRQAHIVADILLGAAMFTFVMTSARRRTRLVGGDLSTGLVRPSSAKNNLATERLGGTG